MKIGKYKRRKTCRLCSSNLFNLVIDLDFMPHAGDFLTKNEISKEYFYPLKIWQCRECSLVQIMDIISPKTLFDNYHYLSSVSLSNHFEKYADEMTKKFLDKGAFAVEIGSNDGVLLLPLKINGIKVLGVDPAKNVAKQAEKRGIKTIVKKFSKEVARDIVKKYGKADAIFANNVLAHIDNLNEVLNGIKILLKEDGIFVAEVHYFPGLISKLQYDFFYNEHLTYFSFNTYSKLLNNFGMKPFNIKKIPIHSGSIRVYATFKKNNKYKLNKKKLDIFKKDKTTKEDISIFRKKVFAHKERLNNIIQTFKEKGLKIAGYGASGRANTLLNYCGLNSNVIDFIVDESPERYGKYTPGSHIPIVKPEKLRHNKNIKYTLLLAWNYKQRIIEKEKNYLSHGGKFIIPLPTIKIYPNK